MKALPALAVCGVVAFSAAHAQTNWPPDVSAFIERRDRCDHFRGEDPFDDERRKFLQEQTLKSCVGTDAQLAALRKKYGSKAAWHEISDALPQYDA